MTAIHRCLKELQRDEDDFLAQPLETQYLRPRGKKIWKQEQKKSNDHREDRWGVLSARTIPNPGKNQKGKTRAIGSEIVSSLRKHLANLQGTRCCYCRRWLQNIAHARPVEHILSRDDYPQFSLHYRNLALACRDCNQFKSNDNWSTLPLTIDDYPNPADIDDFFHPRLHVFDAHIRYVRVETNDTSVAIYQGLTKQGRHLCREHLTTISQFDALCKNNPMLSTAIERLQAAGANPDLKSLTKLQEFVDTLHDAVLQIAKS